MSINYFFLWNYNKLPLVYSIMSEHEKNILIINISDCANFRSELYKLGGLKKVERVVLFDNNLKNYLLSILYRAFIYAFKKKKGNITFYLDGCFGRYPIILANYGDPDEVIFYEEGEGTYRKDVLFKKIANNNIKYKINEFVKKMLFIKKNSIEHITKFYIRDKQRLMNTFNEQGYKDFKFEIKEINDVECLKNISSMDRELFLEIFFKDFNCDFTLKPHEKRAVVLTQPTYLYGFHSKEELAEVFNSRIEVLKNKNYKIYLKMHPLEKDDIYTTEGVQRIQGSFPFELLSLFDIEFDMGLTYNSTAINSSLIKDKWIIQNESKI